MRAFALLAFLAISASADKARFDNYRVYSVLPRNQDQMIALRSLESEYNFWSEMTFLNTSVQVMVPPHKRDDFQTFLDNNNLESEIQIEDVQSLIDAQETVARSRPEGMEWTNYHRLEEVYKWMDELAEKYPNNVKVVVGGETFEKRQIKGVEITFGKDLTGVLLESGIHAREWIGPAASSWIVNKILEGKSDPVFQRFNYLYFPSLNPDGYVYTWDKNRMWRKTRRPYKMGRRTCYGADPNRNWDFHWGEVGTSDNPCSETYAGPHAFSEVEMKSFSEYLKSVSKKLKQDLFIAFHSYSQLLLYPWGYTTKPSKNDDVFRKVGNAAAKSLESVHGTKYTVGPVATTIYPTSGTSVEWYYNEFNATLSYVYELRDLGKYGFLLPPEQIVPCAEETFESLKTILLEYEKLRH